MYLKAITIEEHDKIIQSYNYLKRTTLDHILKSSNSFSKLLKNFGSTPVTFNEPLSTLQRTIEPFQKFSVLKKAQMSPVNNLEEKLLYITEFYFLNISLNINRYLKPFTPIVGETFEYVDTVNNFFAFAEQVSHDPSITAFIVENPNITVFGDTQNTYGIKVFKAAVEIKFHSKTNILFHETQNNDAGIKEKIKNSSNHFSFNQPTLYVKGLLSSIPHFDFVGKVKIEDHKNPDSWIELEFIEENSSSYGDVKGKLITKKKTVNLIEGNWFKELSLYSTDKKFIKKIWSVPSDKFITNKDYKNNYLLSEYAYDLNYLPDSLIYHLPHTDSRFRLDQREYEKGNSEEANKLKLELEQMQREREAKHTYKSVYFEEFKLNSDKQYIPKRSYWDDRIKGVFSHLTKIF